MTPPGARAIVAGLLVVIIAGLGARWHMIRGALADPGCEVLRHGFADCGPFADYAASGENRFLTRALD